MLQLKKDLINCQKYLKCSATNNKFIMINNYAPDLVLKIRK